MKQCWLAPLLTLNINVTPKNKLNIVPRGACVVQYTIINQDDCDCDNKYDLILSLDYQ